MTDHRPPKKIGSIEIRIPPETKAAFMRRCRSEGRSASEVLRGLIDDYLARPERSEILQPQDRTMTLISPRSAGITAAAAGLASLALFAANATRAAPDLRAAFQRLDADKDGRLTLAEFAAERGGDVLFLRGEGPPAPAAAVPPAPPSTSHAPGEGRRVVIRLAVPPSAPPPADARAAGPAERQQVLGREFAEMDGDGDRAVSFAEFSEQHRRVVRDAFEALDADRDGRVTAPEFVGAAAAAGLPAPPSEDMRREFARRDRDQDGALTADEFDDL